MPAVYNILAQVEGHIERDAVEAVLAAGEKSSIIGAPALGELVIRDIVSTVDVTKKISKRMSWEKLASELLIFPDTASDAHALFSYDSSNLNSNGSKLVLRGLMTHFRPAFDLQRFLENYDGIKPDNNSLYMSNPADFSIVNTFTNMSLAIDLPLTFEDYELTPVYTARLGHGANSWLGEGVSLAVDKVITSAGTYMSDLEQSL